MQQKQRIHNRCHGYTWLRIRLRSVADVTYDCQCMPGLLVSRSRRFLGRALSGLWVWVPCSMCALMDTDRAVLLLNKFFLSRNIVSPQGLIQTWSASFYWNRWSCNIWGFCHTSAHSHGHQCCNFPTQNIHSCRTLFCSQAHLQDTHAHTGLSLCVKQIKIVVIVPPNDIFTLEILQNISRKYLFECIKSCNAMNWPELVALFL